MGTPCPPELLELMDFQNIVLRVLAELFFLMDLGLIAQGALTKIIGSNRAFHATASVLGKYKPSLWQAAKPQPFGRLSNCNISRFVFELIGCPMPGGTSKECTLCTSCAPLWFIQNTSLLLDVFLHCLNFCFSFHVCPRKRMGLPKKSIFERGLTSWCHWDGRASWATS